MNLRKQFLRKFSEEYSNLEFVQQLAAQLPWFHHVVLMERVKTPEERIFYIQKIIENGWPRNVLVMQIESKLHDRQGKAQSNFKNTFKHFQIQNFKR